MHASSIGIASGESREPERLEQIGVRFANRSFDALAAHRSGGKPTKSWAVSFEQAESGRLLAILDIVLGIDFQLVLTAWESMLDVSASRLGHMIACPGFLVRKAIELIRESEQHDVGVIVAQLAKVQA